MIALARPNPSEASWSLPVLWCLVFGLSEMGTGLGLLLMPELVLGALGLGAGSLPPAATGFVGAFVFGVGGILWLPLRFLRKGPGQATEGGLRSALEGTALVRFVVATWLVVAIGRGLLPMGWALVAGYDGAVALAQVGLLARMRGGEAA